ncbi:Gfo/Idh/MocA family oxidoreductase [Planktomarina temperata]|nr:Gfo/Idh/MocA family oxidoreductase [Planktomarina temperata]
MSFEVAIVGAGNLGSRHLQGLVKSKNLHHCHVVELSDTKIHYARKLLNDCEKQKATFYRSISDLPSKVDCAVIATTAAGRELILEELVKNKICSSFIIEKIAFDRMLTFKNVQQLFKRNNVHAEINFPRRWCDHYQWMKKVLSGNKYLEVEVFGENWGIASNTIHFIDLCNYLSSTKEDKAEDLRGDFKIIDSKRDRYSELTGSSQIITKSWSLSLKSAPSKQVYHHIRINSDKGEFLIDEIAMQIEFTDGRKVSIKTPLQSELTARYLDHFALDGSFNLTPFEESLGAHQILFETFRKYPELKDSSGRWMIT